MLKCEFSSVFHPPPFQTPSEGGLGKPSIASKARLWLSEYRAKLKQKEARKMFKKKSLWLVAIFIAIQWCCIITPPAHSSDGSLKSRVLEYAGKTFTSTQDPSYHLYDLALREYMVDRIQKRFGVALDPKKYSGFDLLEIESCFKFKKSDEPLEMFLKMFPKHP